MANHLLTIKLVLRPVHRCFFCINNSQLFSCSDDKSVALWDMASEKIVHQYRQHTVSAAKN
jgi:WD40 repeat protein